MKPIFCSCFGLGITTVWVIVSFYKNYYECYLQSSVDRQIFWIRRMRNTYLKWKIWAYEERNLNYALKWVNSATLPLVPCGITKGLLDQLFEAISSSWINFRFLSVMGSKSNCSDSNKHTRDMPLVRYFGTVLSYII